MPKINITDFKYKSRCDFFGCKNTATRSIGTDIGSPGTRFNVDDDCLEQIIRKGIEIPEIKEKLKDVFEAAAAELKEKVEVLEIEKDNLIQEKEGLENSLDDIKLKMNGSIMLENLHLSELRMIGQKRQIKSYNNLKKDEIIPLLKEVIK